MSTRTGLMLTAGLSLLAAGCASAALGGPSATHGSSSALARAAEVVQPAPQPLSAEIGPREIGDEVRSEAVPVEGSDLVRGRATVVVEAPLADVRRHVIDYGAYADYLPWQKRSQVLRRKRDGAQEVHSSGPRSTAR